jgi:LAO/AO transport system kinase
LAESPPAREPEQVAALIEQVLAGDARALARALSLVEDSRPDALAAKRELIAKLESVTPAEHTTIGLTGPPGAGKSTLAGALIDAWVGRGLGVGMAAVDPTSRRSGGALLGDRARIRVPEDAPVFIRSMAAREMLGGLSPATRGSVVVLRAVYPRTIVETVGVGQSEIEVETVADSVVLVVQPGSGDALQFMKAGILEIPDLIVVHKWDLGPLAEAARAELESFLSIKRRAEGAWNPPVVGASGQTGFGVEAIVEALDEHRAWLDRSGEIERRRRRARTAWALELFTQRYGALGLERLGGRDRVEALAGELPGTALDAFSELATRAGLETPAR